MTPQPILFGQAHPKACSHCALTVAALKQLQHFTVASGLAADFVSSLEIDSEGTLWVGSITGFIATYADLP